MKRILGFLLLLMWLPVCAYAVDLAWDLDADHELSDGYTIYFTDGEANYNKTVLTDELATADDLVIYADIVGNLNLQPGNDYELYITRYNAAGQSGPSNVVVHGIEGYEPPADTLPPTVIVIPGPITITIGQ